MRFVAAVALALAAVACPASARADLDNPFPDATVVSPGVKLGYTFGGGGWTYGIEVTVLRRTGPDLSAIVAHGPALNLTWRSHGPFDLRLGWQAVSWFIGVEGGPALVHDSDGFHLGLGVSPWLGAIVVPYYTWTFVPTRSSLREAGVYLKLPLCTGCSGSGGSSWDWDDDD